MNIVNHDAEQWVLGAILFDPDALLKAAEILEPNDFYNERHRQIFSAMLDVYQCEAFSVITLSERLNVKGKLEDTGGLSYLGDLANAVPTSANVSYHAKIVKEKAILRRIRQWSQQVGKSAESGIEDLSAFFGQIEQDLIDLAMGMREKSKPYAVDILKSLKEYWQERKEGTQSDITLDDKFNEAIPGLFPKHWMMIGGYTSTGKSTLMNQFIVDGCETGKMRPLVFSLEDSREEKMMMLISNIANIPKRRLITGNLDGEESRILHASELIRKWNPIIHDDVRTIDEIRLKTKKHKMRDGINTVFIDYVQNIHGRGDDYQVLSDAAKKLHRMKMDLDVHIIALSQVTNDAVKNNSDLIALKGAGELAAASDIVLWLKRESKDKSRDHVLDCEIRKNRPFGKTGISKLKFSERWTRIEKRYGA